MGSAYGNAFNAGSLTPYAFGGTPGGALGGRYGRIVSHPTLFPMSSGSGLAGEAGAEAVMPLKRGPDGRLGVAGGGGGGGDTQIIVNDHRTASGSQPVQTDTSSGPDGKRMISLTIRDEVNSAIRDGNTDASLNMQYGLQRQIIQR